MDNFITWISESSLPAAVISAVSLGFVGVLTRAVLGMAKEVITGGKTIKEQLNISERLNIIEQMILQYAKIQRASILGSSLTAENKETVLQEITVLEGMDAQYQIIVEENKDVAEDLGAKIEELFGAHIAELDKLAEVAPSESVTILQKLRDELAATISTQETE